MTSGSERKRRRAHERVKTLYRMEEGANDRRIVQLVYDYRLLSQRQLERLLRRSKPTVQRLLRRLYDHRYLERVFLPLATFGSSPALYVLDKQGIDLLRRMGVEDFTGVPDKTVKPMYIEHTLAINEFRIAVAQACEAQRLAAHALADRERTQSGLRPGAHPRAQDAHRADPRQLLHAGRAPEGDDAFLSGIGSGQ